MLSRILDVHSGIYGIYSRNLTSGETVTLVDPFPGSASRPELSRDGTTLAFVRRVRDKEALVLMYVSNFCRSMRMCYRCIFCRDLKSGTLHYVWYGLTYDATPIAAPMGTYPSFAFTPQDDGIVIWAAGNLWRVPLSINPYGEKVSGGNPINIPFKVKVEKQLAETLRPATYLLPTETADKHRVHSFKELAVDDTGKRAIFQAAGMTYIQEIGSSSLAAAVPVLDSSAAYYSPSFVPNSPNLVLHCKWSETNFTTFELADVQSGNVYDLSQGLPLGRYTSPTLCDCVSSKRKIAFIRLPGDILTGNVLATAGAGIILADITIPHSSPDNGQLSPLSTISLRNLQSIPSDINLSSTFLKLRFVDEGTKLIVQDSGRSFSLNLGDGPDELGKYTHRTLATAKTGTEVAVASVVTSSFDKRRFSVQNVAFVDFKQVFLVNGEYDPKESLRSKPGSSTRGLKKLSLDGGHDIVWSKDGQRLFWLLGISHILRSP